MLQHESSSEIAPGAPLERATSSTRREILLVLGLSLGVSALYSIVDFIDAATQKQPIGSQKTAPLNPSLSDRQVFDILFNLLARFTELMPVLLALFLLTTPILRGARRIGLDRRRPMFDLLTGFGLVALIGIPGIALYEGSRLIGIDLQVDTQGLPATWYAIPLLVLRALLAGLEEEVIVIGYLAERLKELHWRPWLIVIGAALLRGSYHLYQGWGQFAGNFLMGVVFGVFYQRYGRTAPLVIAHFILDVFSFVGVAVLTVVAPQLLPG